MCLCRSWGTQVVEVHADARHCDLPEQVIEVPQALSGPNSTAFCAFVVSQKAEQLVEVPTESYPVLFAAAMDCGAEHIDIPVPHRRRRGQGGRSRIYPAGQDSTARFGGAEHVDIPVPRRWALHVLPDPGGSSSSAVSRDERGEGFFGLFPEVKKSPKSAAGGVRGCPPGRAHGLRWLMRWTQAADEYFEYNGALWKQAWDQEHHCYCWCEVRREDGHCFLPLFVPPWESVPVLPETRSRPSTLSWPCELGAARVQVHGLVDSVREVVLLRGPGR